MEENFLTVKEFAELAEVSTQRIYQMLDKELLDFCKIFGKQKKISLDALQIFGKEKSKIKKENFAANKVLVEQLAIKDKQIDAKDNQILELQNLVKSMQEQQIILTKSLANSQALHAGTIKEHIDSQIVEKKGFLNWISSLCKKRQ